VSVDKVTYLNMGLVLVSCAAAFVVPFELFLFSYAVLGPLHYLTQISWMHHRRYFTKSGSSSDYLLLGALAVGVATIRYFAEDLHGWMPSITFFAFGGALAMAFIKNVHAKVLAMAGVVVASFVVKGWRFYDVTFDLFLPTIVHVCLFTAAFILLGALRGRNVSGIALLGVFAACAASFFLYVPDAGGYAVSEYTRAGHSTFLGLNAWLSQVFLTEPISKVEAIYSSTGGLMIARFIAFCYTYHFLNWFSKTSVIRWHEVPRPWLVTSVVLWLASLGLYAYDFNVGVTALFFLAILHVYLEFPLDHLTFARIGKELTSLVRRPAPGVAPAPAPALTPAAATTRRAGPRARRRPPAGRRPGDLRA